jgi:hypothetical protein
VIPLLQRSIEVRRPETCPGLADTFIAELNRFLGHPIDARRLRELEEVAMRALDAWATERGYDVSKWAARCYMAGIKDPPSPMLLRKLVDGSPMLIDARVILEPRCTTVLLVDPNGTLTEIDCAQWMLENGRSW